MNFLYLTTYLLPPTNKLIKDLFDSTHNSSHSTLYPDVLKIKNNNCCETKICKNAICLLFKNLQIHNLATLLLPGRPSCRIVRNGFVNL